MPKVPMISVVDDDPSVREATKDLIRSMGYAVATFASAEEYLQSARLRDTACLIADVHMPGMSGIDLQNRLIADGDCTPIIFITAFPEDSVRVRVMEAGAIGFMSKPYNDEHLSDLLDQALKSGDRNVQP